MEGQIYLDMTMQNQGRPDHSPDGTECPSWFFSNVKQQLFKICQETLLRNIYSKY